MMGMIADNKIESCVFVTCAKMKILLVVTQK